jgi:hypothetical protein
MRILSVVAVCCMAAVSSIVHAGEGQKEPVMQWLQALPVFGVSGPAAVVPVNSGRGYAVAGSLGSISETGGNEAVFFLKTDSLGLSGSTFRFSTFSRQGMGTHEVHALQSLCDGGFVIAGTRKIVSRVPTHDNAWVICTESNGAVRWMKVFGTVAGFREQHYQIECAQAMPNGNIIVAGQKGDMEWACCLSRTGDVKWSVTMDTGKVVSLIKCATNSVLAGCFCGERLDAYVNLNWISPEGRVDYTTMSIGCPDISYYSPLIIPVNNLSAIVASLNLRANRFQVISYDFRTNVEWDAQMLLSEGESRELTSFVPVNDRECVAGGTRTSVTPGGTLQQLWLADINKSGDVVWDWSTDQVLGVYGVAPINDNEIIVLAKTHPGRTNMALIKLGSPQQTVEATSTVPRQSALGQGPVKAAGAMIFNVQGRMVSSSGDIRLPRGVFFRKTPGIARPVTSFQSVR